MAYSHILSHLVRRLSFSSMGVVGDIPDSPSSVDSGCGSHQVDDDDDFLLPVETGEEVNAAFDAGLLGSGVAVMVREDVRPGRLREARCAV